MIGLYSKLAAVGIRKNGKSYIPFILTASLMIMIFYIVAFLSYNPMMAKMRGGEMMAAILMFGTIVMAVFSAIFLFYTNSFLIKRRKKEFGLYNILGLGKWQIAHVLMLETLMVYAVSMIFGLGLGILFSKLAEMLAAKMLSESINYIFYVDFKCVIIALIWYAAVFAAILLNSLRQLYFSKPIELLHSEKSGERPPKTNLPGAVIGLILLIIAYVMAVRIQDPVMAIAVFFLAVILVIIATYLLFIAGSVAMCRILQKNKRYYYKINHFVSVSQMAYRMKRNGAGLASICILATMVLVTVSSTTALYAGINDYVSRNYPSDFIVSFYGNDTEELSKYLSQTENMISEMGFTPQNQSTAHSLYLRYDMVITNIGVPIPEDTDSYYYRGGYVYLTEDYQEVAEMFPNLADNEIAVYEPNSDFMKQMESIRIQDCEFKIIPIESNLSFDVDKYYPPRGVTIYLFVNSLDIMSEICGAQDVYYGEDFDPHNMETAYSFDISDGIADPNDLQQVYDALNGNKNMNVITVNTRLTLRNQVIGIYGGLFFLGILMGGVFIIAAALIMYYKQISEGFEDAERFKILRKVGMSKAEIKSSVNSQILTVFFIPLAASGIHMCFAFPLVSKLLSAFDMNNTSLFALTTLGSFALFAVIYILVYKATSKSYQGIVSKD